ncbi:MAG: hypothetical protein ACPLRA_01615, partial [Candidatus Saccharicenans sp.]
KEIRPQLPAKTEAKAVAPIAGRPKIRRNFGMTISSGLAYLSPSDLNRGAQGVIEYYLYAFHSYEKIDMKGLHLTFLYGLDFFYQIDKQLYLSLGFDYLQSSRNNRRDFAYAGSSYSVAAKPAIRDLPLRISLFYQPLEHFYFRIGIETHLARINYCYRLTEDESWMVWRGKASGLGLGWLEAVGLDWPVSSWFRVFFEGSYRYLKLRNLEGQDYYSDSAGQERTEKGKLYYWERQVSANLSFPALYVRENLPTEPGVVKARKAEVDFSGFSLRAGLKFRF